MPKQDLAFNRPLMNAAGALGFAQDTRSVIAWNVLELSLQIPYRCGHAPCRDP
jgi:hypothetical protein